MAFPKFLILLLISLLALRSAFSQSMGVEISPTLTHAALYQSNGLGLSGGMYADFPVYQRLGISTGIQYTQLVAADRWFGCLLDVDSPCPQKINDRFDVVEIPAEITLDAWGDRQSAWRLRLSGGYAYARIVAPLMVVYYHDSKTIEPNTMLHGLVPNLHQARVRAELRHQFRGRMDLALGGHYSYTRIYDQTYGGVENWRIYLKAGVRMHQRH